MDDCFRPAGEGVAQLVRAAVIFYSAMDGFSCDFVRDFREDGHDADGPYVIVVTFL